MDIHVASTNPVKLAAVEEVLQEYELFRGSRLLAVSASSEISDQPKTLDETMLGAMNRARNAYADCEFSIGLESGMMNVKYPTEGKMIFCSCIIYDGKEFFRGNSPSYELPKDLIECVEREHVELNEAVEMCGYTGKGTNIGAGKGLIGVLTKDKITRKDYMKHAIHFALMNLDKNNS